MQAGTVDVGATVTAISGNNVTITAMSTDENSGNTYLTGNISLGTDGNNAILVEKAHSVFSWIWTILDVNLVNNGFDVGEGIALRPDGNVIVAGVGVD